MSGADFTGALNGEQLAAVMAPDGPVLVIAAAGTGKTRTLTYRVAYLVGKGVDPCDILLLTFTNRAAREMLDRAKALVGDVVSGLWGGTFHHMANRILRRHASAIGYRPDYTILDEDDAVRLIRACVKELDLKGPHMPKPEVLLGVISEAANKEAPVLAIAARQFQHSEVQPEDVAAVAARYAARKRDLSSMDFDDLLVNGLKLFRDHPGILELYQERFLHVLVDEYQDTNPIQAEWVDRVAARRRNLLVVGDDFQSIYSWRGADFRNIMTFPERYPDARMYKLETNYRSVPGILDVANACIAGNPEQFQKVLKPVRKSPRRPLVVKLRDGRQQARWVADRLHQLRRAGRDLSDVAILYRSHYLAMELQMELAHTRIPFVVMSGIRFFEQAHIKDVCALLRVLTNPEDELAFARLLQLFPKAGERTCSKIWEKCGRRANLLDAANVRAIGDLLPAAARPPWKALAPILDAYENESLRKDPGEIIFRFVKIFYREYAVETFDNHERRLEDIEELIRFTSRFETAQEFLGEVALLTNLDTDASHTEGPEEAVKAVRLTTVHQAKGLEWGVVILLWLCDGLFPALRSLSEPGGEAEERRLFYVAATRAKDELYMCVPEKRYSRDGGAVPYGPSRFVREIAPALLDVECGGY